MTWHGATLRVQAPRYALSMAVLASLASGCSDGAAAKKLTLTSPESGQEMVRGDDADLSQAGLQFDVKASSTGLDLDTPVKLFIGDETEAAAEAMVLQGGNVVFSGVTLPPGDKTIFARTADEAVSSSQEHAYVYKTLVINSPTAGTVTDADAATAGVQVTVVVESFAAAGDVTLLVDGTESGTEAPDQDGLSTFTVTLASGTYELGAQAEAGSVTADTVSVIVAGASGCPGATLQFPDVPLGATQVTVGGEGECPADGDPYTTTVVLAVSGAPDGTTAYLFANGMLAGDADVDAGLATFQGVELTNNQSANRLRVEFDMDDECGLDIMVDIDVDCDRPDCTITSPVPHLYEDPITNVVTQFINSGHLVDGRLPVQVATSAGAVGETVELLVDDVETLTGTVAADETATIQTSLADGAHSVQATCTDSTGNVAKSIIVSWTIDRLACEVAVTSPGAGHKYVPADDFDPGDAAVTVMVAADVTGPGGGAPVDCVEQAAAACDVATGIQGVTFESFTAGQGFETFIDENAIDQTLCVEVADRAGNIGRGTVAVEYAAVTPVVAFTSPANGTRYNREGGVFAGNTYVADKDPNTPRCLADIAVSCTNDGLDVELWRVNDQGDDPLVATATCTGGSATFVNAPFQVSTNTSAATLYATQTIVGNDSTLVGTSGTLGLAGDCKAPAYDFLGACGTGADQRQLPLADYELWIRLRDESVDSRPDIATFELVSANGNTLPFDSYDAAAQAANSDFDYRVTPVDLGAAIDTIEVRVTTPDQFGNSPVSEVLGLNYCEISLASEIPVLVSATTDLTTWTPDDNNAHGCGTPDPGSADYEVPVDITVDQLNDRTLQYQIDNGAFVDLSFAAIDSTVCVPVPDDGSVHEITIRLNSASGGTADTSIPGIDVQSIVITDPASSDPVFLAGDGCGAPNAGELDVSVSIRADEIHGTANVLLSEGANMAMATLSGGGASSGTGCLLVRDGPRTIQALVEGTGADDFVDVTVASSAPQSAITGLVATVPPANDPNYRDGMINFEWDTSADVLDHVELLCALFVLDPGDEAAFLAAAQSHSVSPASAGGGREADDVQVRIGQTRHCIVRGVDYADRPGPLPAASVEVDYNFRIKDITPVGSWVGRSVSVAGDIDGDGADDVLIGANGASFVYYGSPDGVLPDAVGTTFSGDSTSFGRVPHSIGDFNDDGVNDLYIGEYAAGGASQGGAYIVFGSAGMRYADASIRVIAGAPDVCEGADICYVGDTAVTRISFKTGAPGDFDGDGVADIAMGSVFAAANSVGRAYVLRGGAAVCATPPCAIRVPADDPDGFYIDGDVASRALGRAIAGLGDVDGDGRDDIVLSASGSGGVQAQVRFVPGRDFGSGLAQLTWTDMALVGSGAANSFGVYLAAASNLIDNGETDVVDLVVTDPASDRIHVYPGDSKGGERFKASSRVTLTGGTSFGSEVGRGYHPVHGAVDGLDADGLQELFVTGGPLADSRGSIVFGDAFRDGTTCSDMVEMEGSCSVTATAISPLLSEPGSAPAAPIVALTTEPAGDLNNDGYVDYVAGNSGYNANAGRVLVLY